jgi:hypothetical protein
VKTFAGLTEGQDRVFAQICSGNDRGHHPSTLKALEQKGMIVRRERTLSGFPPVIINCYDFDIGWHMKWCAWCEQQESEVQR